jgi:hypothetical protein
MPCKILKNGRIVCEYCNDEVTHLHFKQVSSKIEIPLREQHV